VRSTRQMRRQLMRSWLLKAPVSVWCWDAWAALVGSRVQACDGPAEPDQHVDPTQGGGSRSAQLLEPTRPLRLRPTCCRHRSTTLGRPRPLAASLSSVVPIGTYSSKESTSSVQNRHRHACLPRCRPPHLSDRAVVQVVSLFL
jgi:hypothetical protein